MATQRLETYRMNFVDAIKSVFTNYFNFNGRARRKEYWYFTFFEWVVYLLFSVLIVAASESEGIAGDIVVSILFSLYFLLTFIPRMSLRVRRLHDVGEREWLCLLSFIPGLGRIPLFIYFIHDSEKGENKYGPSPKYL